MHPWEDLWRAFPKSWCGLLKEYEQKEVALAARERAFADVVMVPVAVASYRCDQCGAAFHSNAALLAHSSVHGHSAWAQPFVHGSKCPVCKADHRTRLRALKHVTYNSRRCRAVLLEQPQRLIPVSYTHLTLPTILRV